MGLDWLDELGLLKRIIRMIAEDQMHTSVAYLTERAEKKSRRFKILNATKPMCYLQRTGLSTNTRN